AAAVVAGKPAPPSALAIIEVAALESPPVRAGEEVNDAAITTAGAAPRRGRHGPGGRARGAPGGGESRATGGRPPHRREFVAGHLLASRGGLQSQVEALFAHPHVDVEEDDNARRYRPGHRARDDGTDRADQGAHHARTADSVPGEVDGGRETTGQGE